MILQLIEPTAPPITSTTLSSGIDPLMSGTILAILIYIPIIAWILWRKITGTRLFLEKNNIAQIIRLKKKQIDNEGNIHLGDLSFRILTKPVFLKRWFGFTVPLYKADNDVAVTVNFQDPRNPNQKPKYLNPRELSDYCKATAEREITTIREPKQLFEILIYVSAGIGLGIIVSHLLGM